MLQKFLICCSFLYAILGLHIDAAKVSLSVDKDSQLVDVITEASPTVSVQWDKIVQSIVVEYKIGPTLAADAYGAMHTAIYDAWSHYNVEAKPSAVQRNKPLKNVAPSKKKNAMTFAAFFVLKKLFPDKTQALRLELEKQGMKNRRGLPRCVGMRSAKAVLRKYEKLQHQAADQVERSPYQHGDCSTVVDRWTPEHIPIDDPSAPRQTFLTPTFGQRRAFGIESGASYRPPKPKMFLLIKGEVNVTEKMITVEESGEKVAISPDVVGTYINPNFIQQCEEVVAFSRNLTDKTKIIAEFWEDGGGTSFPPGTWLTFGQYVSARDDHTIDEDAKMFLALGNAVRDAGIASWNAKRFYYYARPVRAIRDLGQMGLIGNFDPTSGRHVIEAYDVRRFRTKQILVEDWLTYQTPGGDPSPPFPELTSGHSAFSSAAAEVLKSFTGSDIFGASVKIKKGESRFEPGRTPKQDITLEWPTFTGAAAEAGISRLHGGIHFADGNTFGKELGEKVGKAVFNVAKNYYSGKDSEQLKRIKRSNKFEGK